MSENARVKFLKAREALNNEQRQAVETMAGPVQIVAGPGTGKTKTLSYRIAYMIAKGIAPEQIVALTFTKKAAEEMQARVAALTRHTDLLLPKITTFHGLCYELLKEENLTVATESQRQQIFSMLRKGGFTQFSVRDMALEVSKAKNSLSLPLGTAGLLDAYNQALAEKGWCDFDDLLQRMYQKYISGEITRKYQYILVDEFQDTNELQYALLRELRETDNLFVIGDPLQSIYGFRGANADIFATFAKDFPSCTQIVLHTNYRSSAEVVAVGNTMFTEAPNLRAHTNTPGKVQAIEVLNEYGEAYRIIEDIEQYMGGTDFLRAHAAEEPSSLAPRFADIAVLYRTHHTAKTIIKLLYEHGLPYQVAGEGSPYSEPSVQAIIAILRYIVKDEAQFDIAGLKTFSTHQCRVLADRLKAQNFSLNELVAAIIDTFQLMPKTEKAQQQLRQFVSSLVRFEGFAAADFLAHLDEIAGQEFYDPAADALTLLTIHAAKGLEFTNVYVIGCEEGVLPLATSTDLQEEKRLLYVAATRAKQQLTFLYARSRSGKPAVISSLLDEVPQGRCPRIIDPNLASQAKKIQRRKQKHAQTSLF